MGCTTMVQLMSKLGDIDARIVVNLAAAVDNLKMIDYPLPKTGRGEDLLLVTKKK